MLKTNTMGDNSSTTEEILGWPNLWLIQKPIHEKKTYFYVLILTTKNLLLGQSQKDLRQWHPTPVLLPGKSHGQKSLVGCSPWDRQSRTRLSDFTFTFHFYALEKEMATHSSVLAWRIPGMAEPGGLASLGSHRVGHD